MNSPRKLLVLLVDDSALQVSYARELLADQGFEFVVAANGAEAIAAARRFNPDIVLMDIEMPVMNGIDAAEAMRSQPETAKLPIIMVTSRSDAAHMEDAFVGGCNDYVTKPVHKQELLQKIRALTGVDMQDARA